jgi:predicted O-methyltransferase YrrM
MKVFELCGKMLTTGEATALAECVYRLPKDPVIINIGANEGRSTIAMLETRPDAFIFSIDLKPWREEKMNLIKLGLDPRRVVRVLGNSSKMDWPYLVDMIYVDGDHRFNGIEADCKNWLDKVIPGGLIVFHDYIPKGGPPRNQVAQVVDEFFRGQKPFIKKERVIGFVR